MRCLIAIFICVSLVLRFTEVSEVTWLPRFLPRDEEHKLRNKESEEDTLSFFDCVLTTFSSLFDSLDIRHHFAENDRRERRKRKEHKFRQFIIIRISVCLSVHIFFEWRQRSWVGKHWKEKSIKHKFFFHDRKEKHALLFSVINFLWLKYACAWKSKALFWSLCLASCVLLQHEMSDYVVNEVTPSCCRYPYNDSSREETF